MSDDVTCYDVEAERKAKQFLVAIDPGPTQSAFVTIKGRTPDEWGKVPNDELNFRLFQTNRDYHVAIEMIASYGATVGEEVFETCVWIGKFMATVGDEWVTRIKRHEVKSHLCPGVKGVNDAVIRQRLIDLYGGKNVAIGNKKTPGPLYGIKGDCWQALAVGYVWLDRSGIA